MTHVLRWARRLVLAVTTAVVLVTLAAALAPRVLPVQLLFVRSGSMSPSLPLGSLVVATRVGAGDLGRGDVIVFGRPGRDGESVMHRIVGTEDTPEGRAYVTRGDANDADDPWRVPAQGDGWRVDHAVPGLGYVLGAARAPATSVALVSLAALSLAAGALRRIWASPSPVEALPEPAP